MTGCFIGQDFVVNTTTTSVQDPSIAGLPDGRFVVTWNSSWDVSGFDIRGRLYNADGTPAGDDFIVNTTTLYDQSSSSVTALPDGRFVVMFQSIELGTSLDVRGRLYNSDGTSAGDDFVVNTTTANLQVLPSVTGLPDGRFVAVWRSDESGTGTDIRGRVYNADGTAADDDFVVNTTTANAQNRPNVTGLTDGRFVVMWESQEGSNTDVHGRIYEADGTPAGEDFVVNTTTASDQYQPSIAALPDGRFVATWHSFEVGTAWDIRGRVYNADGTPAGDDFIINSTTVNSQTDSSIASLPDGRFIVTWTSWEGPGSTGDIRGRVFEADGTPSGDDFIVNTTTAQTQYQVAVAALPDGRAVATWNSNEGDAYLIRAAVLNLQSGNALPEITSDGGGDFATREVDENNSFVTSVAAHDCDTGQTLTFSISGGEDASLFELRNGNELHFVTEPDFENLPGAGATPGYQVEVQVSDGEGGFDTQMITVNVADVNESPTAPESNDVTTDEDTESLWVNIGASDPDTGDILAYSIKPGTEPAKGTVAFDNGQFRYTPNANANGPDSFTILIEDGNGGSAEQTVSVTINAVNDAPTLANAIADRNSAINAFWTFQVPASAFADIDSALSFAATRGDGDPLPDWLTFDAATRTFSGTPPRDFAGSIDLKVTASDGEFDVSDVFTLTIPLGQSPELNLTPNADAFVGDDSGQSINGLAGNDVITGGLGNDRIKGGDGDDVIDGGGGQNVLNGDAGPDFLTGSGNLNVAFGDEGGDQLFFTGNQNQLFGGAGNDWLGVNGNNNALVGGDGDEVWIGASGNSNTLDGQGGHDALFVNGVGNNVYGGDGNDWLGCSGTSNTLLGGAGQDWMGVSGTSNAANGGEGHDTLLSVGTNILYGENGNDWLGCSGNGNWLFGMAGDDYLAASGHNNTLDGGAGYDTLVSAAGNTGTRFVFGAGYGQDMIVGFNAGDAATDIIDLRGFGLTFTTLRDTFAADVGGNVVITLNGLDVLTIAGVAKAQLTEGDFLLS